MDNLITCKKAKHINHKAQFFACAPLLFSGGDRNEQLSCGGDLTVLVRQCSTANPQCLVIEVIHKRDTDRMHRSRAKYRTNPHRHAEPPRRGHRRFSRTPECGITGKAKKALRRAWRGLRCLVRSRWMPGLVVEPCDCKTSGLNAYLDAGSAEAWWSSIQRCGRCRDESWVRHLCRCWSAKPLAFFWLVCSGFFAGYLYFFFLLYI